MRLGEKVYAELGLIALLENEELAGSLVALGSVVALCGRGCFPLLLSKSIEIESEDLRSALLIGTTDDAFVFGEIGDVVPDATVDEAANNVG